MIRYCVFAPQEKYNIGANTAKHFIDDDVPLHTDKTGGFWYCLLATRRVSNHSLSQTFPLAQY